jgi:hypothetical protein
MIDEYTDKLPMIPATSVQEFKNRLLPREAGVDRLIVRPVTELVIDDAHSFVEAWASHGLHS